MGTKITRILYDMIPAAAEFNTIDKWEWVVTTTVTL
jgi:hypothetical protein